MEVRRDPLVKGPHYLKSPIGPPNNEPVMRVRGDPPQSGGHALSEAKLAPQGLRVRGEPPKSGGHALSEAQMAPQGLRVRGEPPKSGGHALSQGSISPSSAKGEKSVLTADSMKTHTNTGHTPYVPQLSAVEMRYKWYMPPNEGQSEVGRWW